MAASGEVQQSQAESLLSVDVMHWGREREEWRPRWGVRGTYWGTSVVCLALMVGPEFHSLGSEAPVLWGVTDQPNSSVLSEC